MNKIIEPSYTFWGKTADKFLNIISNDTVKIVSFFIFLLMFGIFESM